MKLPNLLTLSRILILPIFLFFFLNPQLEYNLQIAATLLIISALTDLFDGKIARKYNLESELGKLLDPLADKLTLIAVFSALYYRGIVHLIFLLIVLIREGIILLASLYMYFTNQQEIIKAGLVGKGATFLLYIAAIFYTINDVIVSNIKFDFIEAIMIIAVVLAVVSGMNYLIKGFRYLLTDEKIIG